jgi:hypothetical protein
MVVRSIFVLTLSTLSQTSYAAGTPMPDCGTAKVISGDTCSNVKVEISFQNCAHKADPQLASRIICEGRKIKARYQTDKYRYEAHFKKVEDGWGGVRWESLGAVKQWQKKSAEHQAQVKEASMPPVSSVSSEREPATATPPAVPQGSSVPDAPPATALKFSGFFDARYSGFSAGSDPNVENDHSESGFGLEDGAFYVNYDKDKVALVVDIAFRRGKASDVADTTPAAPNASENANLTIGWEKSQIYVRYKMTDNLVFDFGQFDTVYGVELNDSKDRVFGKTGLVFDYSIPNTHTGFMLEYLRDGFYGKAFAANPNSKGSNGTSSSGDESTEYGAALGYANEHVRGQLGYMTRPMNDLNGGRGERTLMDLTMGATLGRFIVDFEYSMVNDPSKNKLTEDAIDKEDPGTGFLALAQYRVLEPLLLGVRYEHIDNDPGVKNVAYVDAFGGSVHYRLSPELELRTEYNGYNIQRTMGGDKFYDARYNAAAVVTF